MKDVLDITSYPITFAKKESKKLIKWYQVKRTYENRCPGILKLEESIPNSPEPFLSLLISKISEPEPNSAEEAIAEFRTLALLCTRPHFLFGTINKEKTQNVFSAKEFQKFIRKISKFDEKWNHCLWDSKLYYYYVERGTKNLNRDVIVQTGKLDSQKRTWLVNDLSDLYKNYYYSLIAKGYHLVQEPIVNERLVEHCYEKEWLLPLAHVILIRDAQYQMMGKVKYKQEDLLLPRSEKFYLESQNKNAHISMCMADEITYEMASEVHEILGKHLIKYLPINPVITALQQLNEKMDKKLSVDCDPVSAQYSLFKLNRDREFRKKNYEQADLLFPIPDCYPCILAIWLGRTLGLSTSDIDLLANRLPQLLWQRCNISDELGNIISSSRKDYHNIVSTIQAVKDFLNPYQYYSFHDQGTFHFTNQLVRSAKFLCSKEFENISSGSNVEIRKITKIFSSFVVFKDLTNIGLSISHAVDLQSGVATPTILKSYLKKLKKELKKYCQDKAVLKFTCADAVRKKDKLHWHTPIYEFEYDRYDLRYGKIEAEIIQKLTWDTAKDFMLTCLCGTQPTESSKQKRSEKIRVQQWKYIDKHLQRCTKGT